MNFLQPLSKVMSTYHLRQFAVFDVIYHVSPLWNMAFISIRLNTHFNQAVNLCANNIHVLVADKWEKMSAFSRNFIFISWLFLFSKTGRFWMQFFIRQKTLSYHQFLQHILLTVIWTWWGRKCTSWECYGTRLIRIHQFLSSSIPIHISTVSVGMTVGVDTGNSHFTYRHKYICWMKLTILKTYSIRRKSASLLPI